MAMIAMVCGCSGESTNSTAAQRSVTEFTLADDTELVAISGAIRSSGDDVIVRFVAPQGRFDVTTSASSSGEKRLLFDNLAAAGTISLELVQIVTDNEVSGCGTVSTTLICDEARAAVGRDCADSSCPVGTLCGSGDVCVRTNALNRCDAMVENDAEIATRKELVFEPEPCTRSIFSVAPPDVETARFAVAGAGDYSKILSTLREDAEAGEYDFVVLLGDNLPDASTDAVRGLSEAALEFPIPIIALPGEPEAEVVDSPRFINRFGPGDFSFRYGPLRAIGFTSSFRHLGARGLDRIRSLVRLVQREDEPGADFPILAFTHTPPIDPNGARDLGFTSEFQGVRTVSLLNELGVDALFSGHIPASDYGRFESLDLIITAAEGPVLEPQGEIVRVEVGPSGQVSGTSLGEFAYDVQRQPR